MRKRLNPRGYYSLYLPPHIAEAEVLVVDPMLATGGSAISAIDKIKQHGVAHIRFVCLVSCTGGHRKIARGACH